MSDFPSLPLFTDAFLADTGHLSAQETGAYMLLLMMAWRSPGCRIPDNDQKLSRWARVDARTWNRIKPSIMEFWTLADGFWTQKRLSKEREIVSKRAEVARQNGSQGGRPNSLKNNDSANPAGSSWVSQKKPPNPNPIKKEAPIISNEIIERCAPHSATQNEAASAPPDPSSELFGRCLRDLVTASGRTEDSMRKLLGKWIRNADKNDHQRVVDVIDAALEQNLSHPVSWIAAHFPDKGYIPPWKQPKKANGALV